MLTSSPASADSASPLRPTDCAPSSLSSAIPPGNATSPTTGPACRSSPMSTTWPPSSAQLWPTPRSSENENRTTKRTPSAERGEHGKILAGEAHEHSSSPPASRVSQPVPPESAKAVAMTVGSGRRLSAWLPDSGPVGACLKTLLASPAWRSPLRSLTWTLKGYAGSPDEPSLKSSGDLTFWDMTSRATGMASLGFRVCRLSVSELSTDGTGSGSSPDGEMWGTPTSAVSCSGMGPTGGKSHQHRLERDYLDAQAQSHAELWLTPSTRDHVSDGPATQQKWAEAIKDGRRPEESSQRLRNQVEYAHCQTGQPPSSNAEPTASRGQLNPDFVCWLMGYPAGWLNYADSATPSSPKSRRKSSVPSVTVKA